LRSDIIERNTYRAFKASEEIIRVDNGVGWAGFALISSDVEKKACLA
jgi:hypothetical protein